MYDNYIISNFFILEAEKIGMHFRREKKMQERDSQNQSDETWIESNEY